MALLGIEDAQQRLLGLARPLEIERVAVAEARGRYLAEPLIAARTQPPADISAMDGYAMRQADMPGPWQILGESACGHPFRGFCGEGQAVRIATGALMPEGTDMVLMQEDAQRDGSSLSLAGTPPAPLGKHIRRMGNDFSQGAALLPAGTFLGSAQIALVLSAGYAQVAVHRLPRIAIIDSGDELASDPAACESHQIPASNGVMLAAMAAHHPCQTLRLGPVADRMEAIVDALDRAKGCDVIVTSGGASVGDHDLVRPALEAWGAQLDFWKVAIKPGKPIMVATRGSQLIIGLPGNPVSSHVTAFLFLLPLLRKLAGSSAPLAQRVWLALSEPIAAGGPRREYLRGFWDGHGVTMRTNQDSGALAALASANVLIERPEMAEPAAAGTLVPVYLLQNGGIA